MDTVIRKIGNSDGAIIPAALLKRFNLKTGDKISLVASAAGIVITSAKPKYTLDELLAKCDLDSPMPEDVKEWDSVQPVGNESI
ncbi:AbrB/MazE/SpoVT family DNA-binding domain-containing protein [Methylophaga thalassica]|uniref:AbrB/MazE/SpoVT family DNA-binding domain-containing protein n=1 Tax=Methylophaga TaxID=40222 RepID=UPI002E7B1586|nr:hypothetical protein [Methylophaga thalassica]WVI86419.1 hypothetical protein VSX76_07315 [Methylophaga thalassica]